MKAKFLPLLLLAILLQVSMFSFANEMTSARRIRLKNKTEVQHRSIPVTPDACFVWWMRDFVIRGESFCLRMYL